LLEEHTEGLPRNEEVPRARIEWLRSQSARVVSTSGALVEMPAAQTTTSRPP
jgi:hypothetical protein